MKNLVTKGEIIIFMGNKIIFGLDGKNGTIKIKHKIYGNQEIKGKFSIIDDENRVGVKVRNSEIFLLRSEIANMNVSDNHALVQGDMMEIEIFVK